jgi:S-adenosyl-L-methionine methyltransferase
MSRLDSFIRRLEAQRACLDHAAALIPENLPGPVLELGLGNGRTYDHLRERLPGRDIFVFERSVAAHPDCVPPPERLILGDMRETLPRVYDRFAGQAVLAHLDAATGDVAASLALANELAPLILPLLRRPGSVLVSEPPLSLPAADWTPLPLPGDIESGRYHLYRSVGGRRG